jgi:hypothetical protein
MMARDRLPRHTGLYSTVLFAIVAPQALKAPSEQTNIIISHNTAWSVSRRQQPARQRSSVEAIQVDSGRKLLARRLLKSSGPPQAPRKGRVAAKEKAAQAASGLPAWE